MNRKSLDEKTNVNFIVTTIYVIYDNGIVQRQR